MFAETRVEFAGQPLAMVVADTLDAARAAAERAVIDIEPGEAILDIETALAQRPMSRRRRPCCAAIPTRR